jgi:hypothetical protein
MLQWNEWLDAVPARAVETPATLHSAVASFDALGIRHDTPEDGGGSARISMDVSSLMTTPADEPGGTGRVGTASGSRSLAAPTGRAPASSVDVHRPRGLARPPPAVCCRAAASQAAGKLPCATTLSSLDAAVVTRRRRRVTSFAFPLGGAPTGASLHLRLSQSYDGGRATSTGNAPTSPLSLVRTVVSQARGRGAPGARSRQPIYLSLGVSESRIVQPTRPTLSLPWCFDSRDPDVRAAG